MNRLVIVILNFNGRHYLEKFLPGVLQFSEGCEVCVTDNGSTDDSLSYLKNNFRDIRLIELDRNYGFAGGYNRALEQIESEYYLLLNSDVEVNKGWLSPLVRFMENIPDCAACQPKLLSYNERDTFEYAGAAGGFIDKFGYPFCRGRLFSTMEKDIHQYNDNVEIFWASGACMLVRSKAFHEVGGFDPDFFAHMEEIDLCWRLKKNDWKIYYVGESQIFHVGGGTLSKSNPKKTYLNFRNNLGMLIKNLNTPELLKVLTVRMVFDMAALLKFLLFDSPADALSVLKAVGHAYGGYGNFWNKRKTIPKFRKLAGLKGVFPGSIVLKYYFRGKKHYSDLGIQ